MNNLITILLPALIIIESGGDPLAIGDKGEAVGILQIHKCVVDDVNRVYGTKYSYADRLNAGKSKEICRKYLTYWGKHYERKTGKPATLEILSRIWNGGPSGWQKKATEKYWQKVEKVLTKSK